MSNLQPIIDLQESAVDNDTVKGALPGHGKAGLAAAVWSG